ncbi:MAG TPA: nucleotidyltransferase [Proteobacteria bacterium]|nr:nucleotidyltransferase [Pseudomonadota bacterium]
MSRSKINLPEGKIADFCRRNRIARLSLFGSVLREDFNENSDIDVLVEFEPTQVPGFLRLAGMEMELSELLGGRKVDMRTPDELSRYFRGEVMASAEPQYG